MLAKFQRLARDERGIGFLEMAIAAPVLALIFLGIVDISRIVATNIDLEQAAQRTTDFALARRPTNGSTGYLVTEAVAASGRPSGDITVEVFLECNGVKASSFTSVCVPGEVAKRFVSVEIEQTVSTGFNWRAMAAVFGTGSGTYRPVTVTGDSIVRIQ